MTRIAVKERCDTTLTAYRRIEEKKRKALAFPLALVASSGTVTVNAYRPMLYV